LTSVNNEINGTVSNIPDGETVAYSVVLNGLEVGTSLPYTAAESGIYKGTYTYNFATNSGKTCDAVAVGELLGEGFLKKQDWTSAGVNCNVEHA
jgi:hypothetical protein